MAEPIYYLDCEDISIYVFHKILVTNDYTLMAKEGDADMAEAEGKFRELYEEFCKLSQDENQLMYFTVYSELLYLETRFEIASKVVKLLIQAIGMPEVAQIYIDTLRDWKYPIDPKKSIHDEIDKVIKNLKVSQNKIRLKKDELDTLKPEESEDSQPLSLTDQVVELEQALGRNLIDPKETSVVKWVALNKKVREQNEAKKKHLNEMRNGRR